MSKDSYKNWMRSSHPLLPNRKRKKPMRVLTFLHKVLIFLKIAVLAILRGIKRVILRLGLHDKLVGPAAAFTAAFLASHAFSKIEAVPDWVTFYVIKYFNLAPGTVLTEEVVAGILTPLVTIVFLAFIQEFLVRDNNKTLDTLREGGYDGARDGRVGPVARETIQDLIIKQDPSITDER